MGISEEFTGETKLRIITPFKVIVIDIVIIVAFVKLGEGIYSIKVTAPTTPGTYTSPSNDGVTGAFSFTAGGVVAFDNNNLITFTTAYQEDGADENSLQIGSGVIDISKLAKCKYISIELSAHSLKQGDKSFSSVFVARKLKKRLK